jgi:hypothetical protein
MNTRTTNKDISEEISTGTVEISGEMVWERAKELGYIAGRKLNNEDYGQALRELTGGYGVYAKQVIFESDREDGDGQTAAL